MGNPYGVPYSFTEGRHERWNKKRPTKRQIPDMECLSLWSCLLNGLDGLRAPAGLVGHELSAASSANSRSGPQRARGSNAGG